MDFKKKGWFRRYIRFRQKNPFEDNLPTQNIRLLDEAVVAEQEQSLYAFIQPTGLLYGFPVEMPFSNVSYPNEKYQDSTDRAFLIFFETLFGALSMQKGKSQLSDRDSDHFEDLARHVSDFFIKTHPTEVKTSSKGLNLGFLSRKSAKTEFDDFEALAHSRLRFNPKALSFSSLFHNSLLFLDIYFCIRLMEYKQKNSPEDMAVHGSEIHSMQFRLRHGLLRLIIAAAHSSGSIEKEEEYLFQQFLQSAHLEPAEEKELTELFNRGVDLDQIEIPELPWLVRRYILELGIMVVLSDKVYTDSERAFIERLRIKLGLSVEDEEQSQGAVESFMLRYEESLDFLKGKAVLNGYNQRVKERISKGLIKNKDRLATEMQESKELMMLLRKSQTTKLTPEEMQKVKQQTIDILKTIPVFVIIALPFTFITLPMLIKLLPQKAFPTAFWDEEEA